MKILHTADLHLGQVIYQNYDRSDEHRHFFRQLEQWCKEEQPDALLVSGDVFDIQQPLATVKKAFIVKLVSVYIVALPYMTGERRDIIQSILDRSNKQMNNMPFCLINVIR